MAVTVEFFGIPRKRAGVARCLVEAATLSELFGRLSIERPEFGRECLDGDLLKPGYLASINGRTFTRDPRVALRSGDSVLILSADVGG